MQLGSRWKSKKIIRDNELTHDDTVGMEREESPLKKWAIAGAVAVGGIAAYKSGLLKNGIKQVIELGDNYKPFINEGRIAAKQWSKKAHWVDDATKDPTLSLVRKGSLKFSNLKEMAKNPKHLRNSIEDTIRDVKTLAENVQKRTDKVIEMKKANLYETDFINQMREIAHATTVDLTLAEKVNDSSKVRQIMIEKLMELNRQTTEQAARKINRTGYRNATLGDLLDVHPETGEVTVKLAHFNRFEIDSVDSKTFQTQKIFQDFMNSKVEVGPNSFKKMKDTDLWKNIKMDKNILIDEKGKIADIRGASKEMKGFVDSLAQNFQVPVIGFNPLRMFGMDADHYTKDKFGILHNTTINPLVTKLTRGEATIGKTFQNSTVFFAGDEIFKLADGVVERIGKGFKQINVKGMQKRKYGLTTEPHNLHILADLNYYEYEEYTKADGFFKNVFGKIGRKLDIGRQDRRAITDNYKKDQSVMDLLSPDYYTDKFGEMLGDKIKTHKGIIKKNYQKEGAKEANLVNLYGFVPDGEINHQSANHYISIKKGYSIWDALNEDSDITWGQFGRQFFTGRRQNADGIDVLDDDVTSTTLAIFNAFNRASQSLAPFGLDLSTKSKANVVNLTSNLVLKRFLPVYAGYQIYEYMNYLTEWETEDGEKMNMTKAAAEMIKTIDLGGHRIKDSLGLTDIGKRAEKVLAGYDQTPFTLLDITKTAEEAAEDYESGYTAVRKGRWWGLGNTPFTGGKIEYWQPNWYRRTMADVRFSDSMYGSREEYFDNAWFPTPTAPFAPIRHFITDRYHYDKKHYNDRPYLVTSGAFSQIPVFGSVLDATIGRFIKPKVKMHHENWRGNRPAYEEGDPDAPGSGHSSSLSVAQGVLEATGTSSIFGKDQQSDEMLATYITPSGQSSIVGLNRNLNLFNVNQELTKNSLQRVASPNLRPELVQAMIGEVANARQEDVRGYSMVATETMDQLSNLTGMMGFMTTAYVTGSSDINAMAIESSDYAYSFNRGFWDENIGGLGGGLLEIFRRFVPKRRKDVEWVNPIRNTMPDWMPGSEYFTDFKHGDPYSKVAKGELRLPGEGYERLHHMKNLTQLNIGSSYLGKTKEEIVNHLLNKDGVTDERMQDILDTGTKMHAEIEKAIIESGFGIDTEGKIEDTENGILGFYDAMIYDPTSPTGVGILDIKTVSAEKFKKIQDSYQADPVNQKQVNYYLWATGNTDSNGYLMYVNRDNPEERVNIQFGFDEDMLKESFDTLNAAREEVLSGIESGRYSRADLYSEVDRYRILADVAPYSDAFREQKTALSRADLTEEEREEIKQINDRVTAQKQPLRIYPYRFKTANVKKETVTVTRVLDNQTFMTKEYGYNPIRLAGVSVVNGENEEGETTQEIISKFLKKGKKVTIAYDADPLNKVSNDTLKTIRAAVTVDGTNLNMELVKQGVAKEKEDDYSPAAVHARFNALERTVGSIWEIGAHLHTPVNTKLLQVRSGLESYKRREIYGKDFQRWERPIDDFLIPMIRETIERGPITGMLFATFFGSLFGSNAYGRGVGATVGALTYLIGHTAVEAKQTVTRQKWIPKERQEERDLEEYIDMLKYVKNRRLYEYYSKRAWELEHFHVESYIKGQLGGGRENKKKTRQLSEQKRKIKRKGQLPTFKIGDEEINLNAIRDFKVKRINKKLNEIKGDRKVSVLPENATKAIYYYNQSEKTMYGYDAGEPIQNLLSALPKKDRQYMQYFLDAPEEERHEILALAPTYMRRALQSAWGYKVDKKKDLATYFKDHALPNETWIGWEEEVDLDDVKVKLIKKADLDFSEFDVWQDQIDSANQAGEIPLPVIDAKQNHYAVAKRLEILLTKQGLRDVRIETHLSSGRSFIDFNLEDDVEEDIQRVLKEQRR